MGQPMRFGNQEMTRLDVVKRVFQEFVEGDGRSLEGRTNDLIGMIAFARYAETVCPLTLSHDALTGFLDSVHLVRTREEDGTAVGDAIALAAARLETVDERLEEPGPAGRDYAIKSKVMILLTDGQNNAGERTPMQAAELAREWGVRIYAVGVGGGSPQRSMFPFGGRGDVDRATLRRISEATGGFYRDASDAESLRAVYHEIDRMEQSAFEAPRYVDYRELFWPFAACALGCAALEAALANTVFRRFP
jgi:Ca-activated chloride channel family protein